MPNGETFTNHGLSAVKSVKINQTVGLSTSRTNISIYPNPSTALVNVHIEDQKGLTSWEITDIHGTLIATGSELSGEFTIDISQHPKGIYHLKLTQGELQTVRKLALR